MRTIILSVVVLCLAMSHTWAESHSIQEELSLDSAKSLARKDARKGLPGSFALGSILPVAGLGILHGVVHAQEGNYTQGFGQIPMITWTIPAAFGLGAMVHEGFISKHTPPVDRLIGKDPAYVEAYTNEFKLHRRVYGSVMAGAGCAAAYSLYGTIAMGTMVNENGCAACSLVADNATVSCLEFLFPDYFPCFGSTPTCTGTCFGGFQ